jgi:hypothetical protein
MADAAPRDGVRTPSTWQMSCLLNTIYFPKESSGCLTNLALKKLSLTARVPRRVRRLLDKTMTTMRSSLRRVFASCVKQLDAESYETQEAEDSE